MREPWTIEMLGCLRARRGDRVVERFRTHKTAALLALLAHEGLRDHPREALIELLWPDCEPEAGRNSLSQALSALRTQLEPPGSPAGSVIAATRASVRLAPGSFTTDVEALEAARAAGDHERAIALYKGPLLPGHYHAWAEAERVRLADAHQESLRALGAVRERAGDLAGALDLARRAVAQDPLRETAWRDLIARTAATGETQKARRLGLELARTLDRELGAPPSPETRALLRDVEKGGLAPAVNAGAAGISGAPWPSGTVTFLLADAAGAAAALRPLLQRHEGRALDAAAQHGLALPGPDGCAAAFARPSDALACVQALTRGPLAPILRLALDTGEAAHDGRAYRGAVLAHAARLLAAARPGQALAAAETAALAARDLDPALRLTDVGLWRLAADAPAERLFAVRLAAQAPGGAAGPAPDALPGREAQLPLTLTGFVGREEELDRVERAFDAEAARLVTITGPGGIGKTRLALEAARRLAEPFLGAVTFVPLADLDDPRLVPAAIVAALRLPAAAKGDPLDAAVAALSTERRLLVLDNLEQLGEEIAAVVRALLERAPPLRVLATTRRRLGISGERELPLGPLPLPDVLESRDALAAVPSVRVFVERAREVRPDFALTDANAAAVAELCRRLEGIPLALGLAAGRAQVLSPEEMLLRSDGRLDAPEDRRRDVEARHRTLRAAIDWSYRALEPGLRGFFTRLSVFRGGFTLAAAEAVCREPLAVDLAAELRECSLVTASDGPGGGTRFRMLEALREFGAGELSPEERAATAARHAAFFLEEAERTLPGIAGKDQARVLERIDADHDNFRAALAHALATSTDGEAALRLCAALSRFWMIRGHSAEGIRLTRLALDRAPGRTTARAYALRALGSLATAQSDAAAARPPLEEALAIFRERGDREGIGRVTNDLGTTRKALGDREGARRAFEESLAIARERGEPRAIAPVLNNLGALAWALDENDRARALLDEALALERTLGNERSYAIALRNRALIRSGPEDAARAVLLLDEAIAIARRLGDDRIVGLTLVSRGTAAIECGDAAGAPAAFEEAIRVGARAKLASVEAYGRLNLGMLAIDGGPPDLRPRAGDLLREALRGFDRLGILEPVSGCLEHLAYVDAQEGRPGRAARLLGATETADRASGNRKSEKARARIEASREALRRALGAEALDAATEAGRALPVADAVREALGIMSGS